MALTDQQQRCVRVACRMAHLLRMNDVFFNEASIAAAMAVAMSHNEPYYRSFPMMGNRILELRFGHELWLVDVKIDYERNSELSKELTEVYSLVAQS